MSTHQHRRRFLALLLACAGLPLSLAPDARSATPTADQPRAAEISHAHTLNHQPSPEIDMHRKTQTRLILAAAVALLALGVALGVAIERTSTPGSDPLTVYAAELMARGAGQGGTVGDLAEFLAGAE